LEERIDRQEAKLEAFSEMSDEDVPCDLEQEFARQEHKERLEAELNALRKLASTDGSS
jgi:phage shock protein A